MATSVWVMEGHIEEEGLVSLHNVQELTHQLLHVGDVATCKKYLN